MPGSSFRIFLCMIFVGACQTAPEETRTQPATAPASASLPAASIEDPRSQFDFAKEWSAVSSLTDEDERGRQATALSSRWKGRSYRWYGYFMAELCFEARKSCFSQVFERSKTESPGALGGFLLEVPFIEEVYEALRISCRRHA